MLVAPDKFRGSLSAVQAAAAMAAGARRAGLNQVRELPLADGGEGFLAVLTRAHRGQLATAVVSDALGQPVAARFALLPDGTAVVETALAVGLEQLGERIDPVAASSRGAGELVAAALDAGARRVLVGVGGSAMTDGGLGAVEALGWSLRGAEVLVACDVRTPFLAAAEVYAPQKGATPGQVRLLTDRLAAAAGTYRDRTGVAVTGLVGGGAAGGLAGGLAALGADLVAGFDLVAESVGLAELLAGADIVVTGEGSLDATSLSGKVVGEVLARADRAGVWHRLAVAGRVSATEAGQLRARGVRVRSLLERAATSTEAMARAAALVSELCAEELVSLWKGDD